MKLRPYQLQAIEAIRERFRAGDRATLLVLPTGCGKTVVFADILRRVVARGGRGLVLAHRDELLRQAAGKLEAVGVSTGIEKADERAADEPVVVASVQTLRGDRLRGWAGSNAFALMVVDEAHHATAESYRAILDHFGGARVLGVTATPDRLDRQALGEVFDSVAYRYELRAAIRDGWLVPLKSCRVQVESLDLSKVRTTVAGDLHRAELAAALAAEQTLHEIAAPLVELAGDRPTLAFCPDVATAHALAEVLDRYAPGQARALDGSASPTERAGTIADFAAGRFRYLANCALFTEGFDCPRVACVAIARPTKSRALFAQMIGRGTRLYPGKADCLVLDFVGNSGRHRLISPADVLAGEDLDDETRAEVAEVLEVDPQLELLDALDLATENIGERRARVTVRAQWSAEVVDLLEPALPPREMWAHHPATAAQLGTLERAGLKPPEGLTKGEAAAMIDAIMRRRDAGLATFRQAKLLQRYDIDAREMTFDEASEAIAKIAARGWKRRRGNAA